MATAPSFIIVFTTPGDDQKVSVAPSTILLTRRHAVASADPPATRTAF
jgi:hypothetical protein